MHWSRSWQSHLAAETAFADGQPEMAMVNGSQPASYSEHVVSNGMNFTPLVGAVGVNVGIPILT